MSNEDKTPIIHLYSPGLWHGSAAILVNEAGKKLLKELLESQGEISIGEAFVSDGEGFTLGIINVHGGLENPELQKYKTPYTDDITEGSEANKIDPREMVDEKEALDKAEKEMVGKRREK